MIKKIRYICEVCCPLNVTDCYIINQYYLFTMKKLFLYLVLSLICPFSQHLWAEHADFVELSLVVPDGVEAVMDSSNYVMSLRGNNAEGVLVTFGDPSISPKVDYDSKRVLLSFDTICFNLKGCDLLTEATNEGADYRRVMSRRLYRNRRDTAEYATTYTFVTPNRPYAFCFFIKVQTCLTAMSPLSRR